MGKITLCVFMLLVPTVGAFEGTQGGVSEAQPTESSPDATRIPDGPAMVTSFNQTTTLSAFLPGDATTALPTRSLKRFFYGTTGLFLIMSIVACMCSWSRSSKLRQRLAKKQMTVDWSSTSSQDGDDEFSLSSFQAEGSEEGSEDALSIKGLSSADQTDPVVKFRRAKPVKPNDPVVSSLPGDVLDL